MALRVLLFIIILLFSLLGYVTYLNHEISTTFFLAQGKPLKTSLPAVIIVSFVSGALIVFIASLIRDLLEGWRELKREKKAKRKENLQLEIAKGLNSLSKGEVEKGKSTLTNALKADPKNFDIYMKLSDIHASQGELEEAIDVLEKALVIDSGNVEILLKKARIYDQMNKFPTAVDLFEKTLITDPHNQAALTGLRDLHLKLQNWKDALKVQEKILKDAVTQADESRETDLYLGMKYEYAQSLRLDGTEDSLEKAHKLCKDIIKQDREFLPAYILLGDLYQLQKRWAEAGKILGKGFRISRSVVFLLRLEDLYMKRDDPKTLIKIYRRTLQANPENDTISFFYSRLCLRLRMLDEAMDELVEIKKRGKDFSALHGLMAEVLTQKGHLNEALQEYKRSTELSGSLQLHFHCRFCNTVSGEWAARCPSCQRWNTYLKIGEYEPGGDLQKQ
ncbi:MAG: tetratricopeptide repeat protein [Proteobacteria bacterium]|nr:tetratricopeptide repeat protein [Pseudomonadota bacterium]